MTLENTDSSDKKLWGGRFEAETLQAVEEFSSSLSLDSRLWEVDLLGSIAHAEMLGAQKIIPQQDAKILIEGLKELIQEFQTGKAHVDLSSEDIHSDIEKKLNKKLGAVSGKLHTARSRNDQVATDTRLFLAKESLKLQAFILSLQKEILKQAENHLETLMPGLTHMQHAQPVSLAHHLMAYFWMLNRDRQRLEEAQKRILVMPLGSAALAGTGFPLDREKTKELLGFHAISENSLDAVSDRDFIIEFLSNSSLIMMHLSKLSDELVLWSMPEFQFVELSDRVTTGSSIMPQKKNPDVAELIRGRVGRVYGALMGMLTVLKALPLAYNRDLQEDKFHLFEGLDTVTNAVKLTHLMLKEAQWNKEKMAKALAGDFSNATDLADDLVRKGHTFREAHEVIGKIVQYCIKNHFQLENLSLDQLHLFSKSFDSESLNVVKHWNVMKARTSQGGSSPSAVMKQLDQAKASIRTAEVSAE